MTKQLPSTSLDLDDTDTERIVTYKLSQLKQSIELDKKRYSLFGMILFQPPVVHGDLGHYVTAVNVKETYFVFDDLRSTLYRLETDAETVIHCLLYIDSNLIQCHEYDDLWELR